MKLFVNFCNLVLTFSDSTKKITGWGQALEALLNNQADVHNWAISGMSTKTLFNGAKEGTSNADEYYAAQWSAIMKNVNAGDYVLIQYGHNDQATDDEIRGVGIEDYKKNLEKIVDGVMGKGATPVLVTPPERQYYEQGTDGTLGEYPQAMRDVATAKSVKCIDLNAESKKKYGELTEDGLLAFFAMKNATETDGSHFSPVGALYLAKYVASELDSTSLGEYLVSLDSVTEENIEYGKNLLNMTFEGSTKTINDTISLNKSRIGWTDLNGFVSEPYIEEDGNTVMKISYPSAADKAPYLYMGGWINSDYTCLDFRIKATRPATGKTFFTLDMQSRYSGWTRLFRIPFVVSADGGLSFSAEKTATGTETKTFATVQKFNPDGWNKFRFILDKSKSKYHLIVNDSLVCTDIPFANPFGEGVLIFQPRLYKPAEATDASIFIDDIFVERLTERQTAKALLSAANGFIKDKEYKALDNHKGRWTGKNIVLPAHSTISNSRSFTWATTENSVATTSIDIWMKIRGDDSGARNLSADFTSSTAPYYVADLYAPHGYSSKYGDAKAYFTPVITLGTNTYTGTTEEFKVVRAHLNDDNPDFEVGIPRFAACIDNAIAPNGTHNITYQKIYESADLYSGTPEFLNMCDELGFYVVDEADLETHGYVSRMGTQNYIWECMRAVRKMNM